MLVTIYHNPRCSKSRKALELLENKDINLNIIPYLDQGICVKDVLLLAKRLNLNVVDFMRKKEDEFKALSFDTTNNEDCAKAIESHPKLLERPIVMIGEKAIIARPPEDLEKLF
ncbi:MAG: arsenate reductase [Bacteriovoracaceae bacterium]|jgi:arsenate reductase